MTEEQNKLLQEIYDKFNKGIKISAVQLTKLYNEVTGKHVNVVNCGTCLRKMLFELVNNRDIKKIKKVKVSLNKEDVEFIEWTKTLDPGTYPSYERVVEIYNRTYKETKVVSNCIKCLEEMLNDLYDAI